MEGPRYDPRSAEDRSFWELVRKVYDDRPCGWCSKNPGGGSRASASCFFFGLVSTASNRVWHIMTIRPANRKVVVPYLCASVAKSRIGVRLIRDQALRPPPLGILVPTGFLLANISGKQVSGGQYGLPGISSRRSTSLRLKKTSARQTACRRRRVWLAFLRTTAGHAWACGARLGPLHCWLSTRPSQQGGYRLRRGSRPRRTAIGVQRSVATNCFSAGDLCASRST